MTDAPISILFADGISAAGETPAAAMETFYAGRQAFSLPSHFDSHGLKLGVIPDLIPDLGQSRAFALLERLCKRLPPLPQGTRLYLATTVGAIDLLENAPVEEEPDCIGLLLQEAKRITGLEWGTLVAAACASGQTATALAMRALRLGHCEHALVIGLDITSSFVTGGFYSLRAYSPTEAHPYDRNRNGLSLGEGAGALLLSAKPEGAKATLTGAYESCDASHITAPDLTGKPLAALIQRALQSANLTQDDIAAIIGHGTGTIHNDASEIAAISQVFTKPTPLLSIKGNIGHTLGATGVLQIVYGIEFLRRGNLPPQAGLVTPADGAEPFVSSKPQPLRSNCLLSVNVGFGGLNSTVLLEAQPLETGAPLPVVPRPNLPVPLEATISLATGTATFGQKTLSFSHLSELKDTICAEFPHIQADLTDFRRAADNVRLAQLGCILCAATTSDWSPVGTALIGLNGDGSAHNDRLFWNDFVAHGRDCGRASLFVPTLPSIPVCEAAITLGIQGPVRYLMTESAEQTEEQLSDMFASDNTLRQIMTVEITATSTTIRLYQLS